MNGYKTGKIRRKHGECEAEIRHECEENREDCDEQGDRSENGQNDVGKSYDDLDDMLDCNQLHKDQDKNHEDFSVTNDDNDAAGQAKKICELRDSYSHSKNMGNTRKWEFNHDDEKNYHMFDEDRSEFFSRNYNSNKPRDLRKANNQLARVHKNGRWPLRPNLEERLPTVMNQIIKETANELKVDSVALSDQILAKAVAKSISITIWSETDESIPEMHRKSQREEVSGPANDISKSKGPQKQITGNQHQQLHSTPGTAELLTDALTNSESNMMTSGLSSITHSLPLPSTWHQIPVHTTKSGRRLGNKWVDVFQKVLETKAACC